MPKIVNNGITYCGTSANPISNPNLIINGDFRINQRGQSTYSSGGWSTKTYTVDRWCLYGNPNSTITVNEDKTLTLKPNSIGEYWFNQYLEEPLPISDYTLTVKILNLSGDAICHINGSGEPLKVGINSYTLNGSVENVGVMVYGSSSITIEYIKLEQGSIATPFIPRLYAEELALCQRYYQILGEQGVPIVHKSSGNQMFVIVNLKTQMRVTPSVVKLHAVAKASDGTSLPYTSYSASYTNNMKYPLDLTFGGTVGVPTNSTGISLDMTLDAEIY